MRPFAALVPTSSTQRLVKPGVENIWMPKYAGADMRRCRHVPSGDEILDGTDGHPEDLGDVFLGKRFERLYGHGRNYGSWRDPVKRPAFISSRMAV